MGCEQCGASPQGYGLFDYCAECNATLCDDCMELGHCDNVPALSGMERDYPEDEDGEEE